MFERKSFEQILGKMLSWSQGVSTKITDYRVGSKIRTIYESVAIVLEEMYDDLFKAMKQLMEDNLYSIFSFEKLPSVNATGTATFGRLTQASQDYIIPSGTIIATSATTTLAPIKFYTTSEVTLLTGETSISAPIICAQSGKIGNVESGTITNLISKPTGIESVINNSSLVTGRDTETKEEQKYRFQKFMASRMRGTREAIEYGALTANVLDINDNVIERVIQSKAFEYVQDPSIPLGEVNLFVWNGVGDASIDLLNSVSKIIYGYYDSNNVPVYGYKSAGIKVNIFTTPVKYIYVQLEITPESFTAVEDLKSNIQSEIDMYFNSLLIGGTLIQTALESNIKLVYGVKDVKLGLSSDGITFTTDNFEADLPEQMLSQFKPTIYI